jgi:hypothetical protein
MPLGKLLKVAIPTVVGAATGGPAGAFAGFVGGTQQEKAERQIKQQNQRVAEQQRKEREQFMEIFGTGSVQRIQQPMLGSTAQSGFGAGFGTFLGDVGRNIVSPFASLASTIAPFFGRGEIQQPAVTTTRRVGAQESQTSGSQEAFIGGGGIAPLLNIGRQFLRSPVGQIGTGTAVGGLVGALTGPSQPSMRITRKMKNQARMVLNMTGGNLSAAADILGIDQDTLIFILLKRFRNDGPVVTKAALRKTKQTVRRLKSMCDMYDDLKPRATARRRAPMRRSTTTLIKN